MKKTFARCMLASLTLAEVEGRSHQVDTGRENLDLLRFESVAPRSASADVHVELSFGIATIFEEGEGPFCEKGIYCGAVRSRTYNGVSEPPVVRVNPGDTLHVALHNHLPPAPVDTSGLHNTFHDFEITNLHTHGLHISSLAPSDSIAIKLRPNETYNYVFHIDDAHMGGLHWFHPHHHGSTAIHAGGGGAGLLVVNDLPGMLPAEVEEYEELNLVLFHLDPSRLMTISKSYINNCVLVGGEDAREACEEYALFDDYDDIVDALPDIGVVLINGKYQPTAMMVADRWYRLRVLYVSVDSIIQWYIEGCELKLIAKDGVYLHKAPRDILAGMMASGNRADLLVKCPAGEHSLLSGNISAVTDTGTRRTTELIDQRLATLIAEPDDGQPDCTPPTFSVNRPCYLVDLRAEHVQPENTFALVMGPSQENSASFSVINEQPWVGHDHFLHNYTIGSVAQLDLYGTIEHHPVHVHVNPFQIDTDVSEASVGGYFQQGDWHDTLLIADPGTGCTDTVAFNQVNPYCVFPWNKTTLKFQTDKYTGPAIVHCHILRHEDAGMMGSFNIVGDEGATWPGARRIDPTCYYDAHAAREPVILEESSCAPPPKPKSSVTPSPSPSSVPDGSGRRLLFRW